MKKQLLFASLFLGSVAAMLGQTAALPAPAPVSQIYYRHWPEHFMQFVGAELPCSMFEVYVDNSVPGVEPSYDVVLTDRTTWKRTHYSNVQALVDFNKRTGGEAYLANIKFDRPDKGTTGSVYTLRFSDHSGVPVQWQFVQGSEVSEQGGGLSPAGVQPPVLMFRERAAVAGEGTALKIGNVISTADIWKEIAKPPYFVPYHGAFTENVEIATFVDGGGEWTVEKGPEALAVGAEWQLKSPEGRPATLTVTGLQGGTATLVQADPRNQTRITIEAQFAGGAWTTRRVHFAPAAHSNSKGLTVAFGADAKFEVQSGKTRLAQGALVQDAKTTAWQFKSPEWLRGKVRQTKESAASVGGK